MQEGFLNNAVGVSSPKNHATLDGDLMVLVVVSPKFSMEFGLDTTAQV
jgi:hypothetical protein